MLLHAWLVVARETRNTLSNSHQLLKTQMQEKAQVHNTNTKQGNEGPHYACWKKTKNPTSQRVRLISLKN